LIFHLCFLLSSRPLDSIKTGCYLPLAAVQRHHFLFLVGLGYYVCLLRQFLKRYSFCCYCLGWFPSRFHGSNSYVRSGSDISCRLILALDVRKTQMLAWLAWMAGCHLISSIQFPGMLHPVPELTYYYLIYQTHSGALGRTPLGIRILLIIFVFPKATEHCFRFPCLQPNSYNWRLVAGHSWLKCACFYSPQTPA